MASQTVLSLIAELQSPLTAQSNKSFGYQELLHQIVSTDSSSQLSADLSAFVNAVLSDSLGIVAARPLLQSYVEALKLQKDLGIKIESGRATLLALDSRVVSFEEQDAAIREILADAYQEEGSYIEAAQMLQGIQLESSQRKVSDRTKVKTWIRICRLHLEEDDTTSAESYLNRAKNLLHKVEDKELNLMFQLSQARILDSRRRFLDACQAYHSFSMALVLAEEERSFALSKAIICAVLAPAGPQRSQVLGRLFKDDRAIELEEFSMLENMFLDRLISPIEVVKFSDRLAPHQLARTADGSTVLAKAVIEHNLLAASKLYGNIDVLALGYLLDLDAAKAEGYAARMLEQRRLMGRIDQIEGVLFFDGRAENGKKSKAHHTYLDVSDRELRRWDGKVQNLIDDVERVSSIFHSLSSVRI